MLGVSLSDKRHWGIPGSLFLGSLAFIGPQFLAMALMPVIAMGVSGSNMRSFAAHALYQVVAVLLIVAFVNAYGRKLGDIGLGKFKNIFFLKALLGFGAYVGLTIATMLIVDSLVQVPDEPQPLGFFSPNNLELIFVFISLVVLAPFAEELLFRGFMYTGIRRKLSFEWTALIVSLLFAVAHGQLNVGLDVFVLSLVLCYLREHTASLWPSILVHALKNGVAFFFLFIYTGPK